MTDFTQLAIILAVAAGLFFGLGVYFAGGRSRAESADLDATLASPPDPVPDPEVAALRAELEQAKSHVLDLEGDLAKARDQLQSDNPTPTAADLGSEIDPELGPIYALRPEHADDLTQIRGVGAALSRQLNGLGVYTLAQIGAWEKSQVEAVSVRLSFKDRIVRDDWVGQARRLGS